MDIPVKLNCVIPTGQMKGEDAAETESLQAMLSRAEAYLRSFDWFPGIAERYLGVGIGGVIGLFLFRLARPIKADEWLWVIEGDLPSAYFVVDAAPDPASALTVYCNMMQEWIDAVTSNAPLDGVFPVTAPPTSKYAEQLRSRITFIKQRIIPTCECE